MQKLILAVGLVIALAIIVKFIFFPIYKTVVNSLKDERQKLTSFEKPAPKVAPMKKKKKK